MSGNPGCRFVKRLTLLLFGLLFLLSGPAWVWVDCSHHIHHGLGEEDLFVAHVEECVGYAQHDDWAARFHCPPLHFDTQALASLQVGSKPKPRQEGHIKAAQVNFASQQASLTKSINDAVKFSFYPFLAGDSPHLLFSVLRI